MLLGMSNKLLVSTNIGQVTQSVGINQLRVVDENRGAQGSIPPQRQPVDPRGRASFVGHIMYEEDHVDFYGTGSPRDIFFS